MTTAYRRRGTRGVRRAARPAARPARSASHAPERGTLSLNAVRTVVCGVVFVTLVALKLLLPDGLAGVRRTLGTWLTRDADFVSAFSAVGRAVSGEGGALDSLEDAYVAVFGAEEAAEVSGSVELPDIAVPAPEAEAPPYPERAAAEQRVLGFDYAAPLSGEVTSPFGWREHPTTGREAFHYGVDIAADEGAAVACFADGTVGAVGESVELGNYLTVHHANGVLTLYAHLSRVSVASGEAVSRGDKLGEAGHTGNATGTHLHFEIHDGEDYLNPKYYLP
ncbi:MAG: peptidoglycan DD-metalloendopeptidase family protein [Oscillospiraceae bacterium]|nr:peptidoglycan DD-metalloendopeptidase family protein [Oscillospiraceae bacterium]